MKLLLHFPAGIFLSLELLLPFCQFFRVRGNSILQKRLQLADLAFQPVHLLFLRPEGSFGVLKRLFHGFFPGLQPFYLLLRLLPALKLQTGADLLSPGFQLFPAAGRGRHAFLYSEQLFPESLLRLFFPGHQLFQLFSSLQRRFLTLYLLPEPGNLLVQGRETGSKLLFPGFSGLEQLLCPGQLFHLPFGNLARRCPCPISFLFFFLSAGPDS